MFNFVVALIARLELATQKNQTLRNRFKREEQHKMQNKLASLRLQDYQKLNPPKIVPLPIHQLPDQSMSQFSLNGKTDLKYLFDKNEEDHQQEEIAKKLKQEPRYFTKIMKQEEEKDLKKKGELVQSRPKIDRSLSIEQLNLKPFDKNEKLDHNVMSMYLTLKNSLPKSNNSVEEFIARTGKHRTKVQWHSQI